MKRSDYINITLIVMILLVCYGFGFYCWHKVRFNHLNSNEPVRQELVIIEAFENCEVYLSDGNRYWTLDNFDAWNVGDTVIATFINDDIQTIKLKKDEQ